MLLKSAFGFATASSLLWSSATAAPDNPEGILRFGDQEDNRIWTLMEYPIDTEIYPCTQVPLNTKYMSFIGRDGSECYVWGYFTEDDCTSGDAARTAVTYTPRSATLTQSWYPGWQYWSAVCKDNE
jgi:hypothetical protein